MTALSEVRIVRAGTLPSFLGSFLRIHLDWSIQTALLSHMIQLVVHSTHIICYLTFLLPFLISFHYSFMLWELGTTRTCPSRSKSFTLLTFFLCTLLCKNIMFFEGMFAKTLEVIGTMRGYVIKILTFTLRVLTTCFSCFVIEVIMIFELVVTKAFCLRSNHLAFLIFAIPPTIIQSIFALLRHRESHRLSNIHILQFFSSQLHSICFSNYKQ